MILIAGLLFCVNFNSLSVYSHLADSEILEDKDFWYSHARASIERTLHHKQNTRQAKNVVVFVGDGMGINTITASRIYKAGEFGKLSFEQFPHVALMKTYSVNKQVPDSASTATALFCGVKANHHTAGVDARVKAEDCEASLSEDSKVDSIITWAQKAGKHTGFVTTTRVTHATPSALYAHVASRKWECDDRMPPLATHHCKDIARQMVEDEPGKNIRVIMGGGRQCMVTNSSFSPRDPEDVWSCKRKDGKDLVQEWALDKTRRGYSYKYVTHTEELSMVNVDNTDFLLGIFANGHTKMNVDRDKTQTGTPSLEQMTSTALRMLMKNKQGFLLVVEGGLIDFAHHRGKARRALDETLNLDHAVENTMAILEQHGILDDTLVLVTADHDHGLSISGYPDRGNDIYGIAMPSRIDNVPFTTLTYATGSKDNYQYSRHGSGLIREDPSKMDYTSFDYYQQAGILNNEVAHGGGDVPVYATGPMAHLFHGVQEQNYVAFAVAYAARIGPYSNAGSLAGSSPVMFVLTLTLCCCLLHKGFHLT
uniref:Alkaline phosphatase n=1 Tax=Cacopsylla melanoneura TaxID=428564 RepID=A0A8D8VFS4_9HEMI